MLSEEDAVALLALTGGLCLCLSTFAAWRARRGVDT